MTQTEARCIGYNSAVCKKGGVINRSEFVKASRHCFVLVTSRRFPRSELMLQYGVMKFNFFIVGLCIGAFLNSLTSAASAALVQSRYAPPQGTYASVSVALPATQVAGNVVVAGWNDVTATFASVSDLLGHNHSLAAGPVLGKALTQAISFSPNTMAGSNKIIVKFSAPAVSELSRLVSSRVVDGLAQQAGSNALPSSGTFTTSAGLIFAAGPTSGGFSIAGTGYSFISITRDEDIREYAVKPAVSNSASAPLSGAMLVDSTQVVPAPNPTAASSPTPAPAPAPSPTSTSAACADLHNTPGGADPFGACWPGPNNTGVPAGIVLSTYTGPCDLYNADNLVIDSKAINCDLLIYSKNVTIKNSKINGVVIINNDTASLTIRDSTIDAGKASNAGLSGDRITALRINVMGGEHSVACWNDCVIRDSYLHDQYDGLALGWHQNAFFNDGGSNYTIIHNTVGCVGGCTGDISFINNNSMSHATVDKNLLLASPTASYCAYPAGGTSSKTGISSYMVWTNNVLQRGANRRCGYYGPVYEWNAQTRNPNQDGYMNVWSGNIWDDGTAVRP